MNIFIFFLISFVHLGLVTATQGAPVTPTALQVAREVVVHNRAVLDDLRRAPSCPPGTLRPIVDRLKTLEMTLSDGRKIRFIPGDSRWQAVCVDATKCPDSFIAQPLLIRMIQGLPLGEDAHRMFVHLEGVGGETSFSFRQLSSSSEVSPVNLPPTLWVREARSVEGQAFAETWSSLFSADDPADWTCRFHQALLRSSPLRDSDLATVVQSRERWDQALRQVCEGGLTEWPSDLRLVEFESDRGRRTWAIPIGGIANCPVLHPNPGEPLKPNSCRTANLLTIAMHEPPAGSTSIPALFADAEVGIIDLNYRGSDLYPAAGRIRSASVPRRADSPTPSLPVLGREFRHARLASIDRPIEVVRQYRPRPAAGRPPTTTQPHLTADPNPIRRDLACFLRRRMGEGAPIRNQTSETTH